MDVVSWLLSKKYTDNSLIGIGALKGAPCKVKSVIKKDGQNIVTLTWKDDLGVDHDTKLEINDGTPIYTWEPNYHYEYGDLVIYQAFFYRCRVANSDSTFVESHWDPIGNPDGAYGLVETKGDLPSRYTSSDRKLYYVIDEYTFYLWDGYKWELQETKISDSEIDDLFI